MPRESTTTTEMSVWGFLFLSIAVAVPTIGFLGDVRMKDMHMKDVSINCKSNPIFGSESGRFLKQQIEFALDNNQHKMQ